MTKDHILAEICRTAAPNGGMPLGRERFFAETGIKEPDWRGKYWVRWSDAVRAAGLEVRMAWDQGLSRPDLMVDRAGLADQVWTAETL